MRTNPNTVKDVSLTELLRFTSYYADTDTFRWFTVHENLTVRVTFGEVRKAVRDA